MFHCSDSVQVGRPKEDINLDDVEFLISLNLSIVNVAKILGVSRATVYRRLKEQDRYVSKYSTISDSDLDDLIRRLKESHPYDGEVMMAGNLHRSGICVPRSRLRASIHRVDPEGVVERARRTVKRRVYSVPCSNYVWHIDSHHKLIRWRLVIHGAVDGYSRKIMYLVCATNNEADTVVHNFSNAVCSFGLPDKVRSDKGGENVQVWRYTLHYHEMDPACVVIGSSTHNERIERMWCDVKRCVGQIFHQLLYSLEGDCMLDPLNEVDLFCVHFAILPEVNRCLLEFVDSWNHHCLSTENNLTPEQLYVIGMLERQIIQRNVIDDDYSVVDLSAFGIELDEVECVSVPSTPSNVCSVLNTKLIELQRFVLSVRGFSDFGRDLYVRCIEECGSHLLNTNCLECFQS